MTRGFQQIHGVGYDETLAPVTRFSTMTLMFAVVTIQTLERHQMDVKSAFLNVNLKDELYMEQPEGCADRTEPDYDCKLLKAIYGLKRAPRQWFAEIDSFLCGELQFQSCAYDSCFYVLQENGTIIMTSLYIDDPLTVGLSIGLINTIKKEIISRFRMENCSEAKVCLGFEIARDRSKRLLTVTLSSHAEKISERFELLDCKPASSPRSAQVDDDALKTDSFDSTSYRQAIGSLMYVMIFTRPDITFADGRLSRFMEIPTTALWTCVKTNFSLHKRHHA